MCLALWSLRTMVALLVVASGAPVMMKLTSSTRESCHLAAIVCTRAFEFLSSWTLDFLWFTGTQLDGSSAFIFGFWSSLV